MGGRLLTAAAAAARRQVSGSGGAGVGGLEGGALQLRGSRLEQNRGGGLNVGGTGARCLAEGCHVLGNAGSGVAAADGAELLLTGGVVGGNQRAGVLVQGGARAAVPPFPPAPPRNLTGHISSLPSY